MKCQSKHQKCSYISVEYFKTIKKTVFYGFCGLQKGSSSIFVRKYQFSLTFSELSFHTYSNVSKKAKKLKKRKFFDDLKILR